MGCLPVSGMTAFAFFLLSVNKSTPLSGIKILTEMAIGKPCKTRKKLL